MKTPAATAMAVGQTTINNQLIVAVATVTEMMTMKAATLTTKARQGLQHWWRQRGVGRGSAATEAAAAATAAAERWRQLLGNNGGTAVVRWVERRQRGGGGRIALAPRGGGNGGGGSVDYLACGWGGSSCGSSMTK